MALNASRPCVCYTCAQHDIRQAMYMHLLRVHHFSFAVTASLSFRIR